MAEKTNDKKEYCKGCQTKNSNPANQGIDGFFDFINPGLNGQFNIVCVFTGTNYSAQLIEALGKGKLGSIGGNTAIIFRLLDCLIRFKR